MTANQSVICECRGHDDLCACQNQPEKVRMPSQAAFTKDDHPYPGYINITREGEEVVIMVRGDAREDREGPIATPRIRRCDWLSLHIDAGYRL